MKTSRVTLLITLLLTCVMAFAGQQTEVRKEMKDFDTINMATSLNVVYVQGIGHYVRIVGEQDAINKLDITQNKRTVNISTKMKKIGNVYQSVNIGKSKILTIYVVSPYIKTINLAGSGTLEAEKINMPSFSLSLNVAGSGEIKIKNINVGTANVSVAGSGEIKVGNLQTVKGNLAVTGSGDINATVNCSDELNCAVAGSGDIYLSGTANNYNKSIVGSGSVSDSKLKAKQVSSSDTKTLYRDVINQRRTSINGIVQNP